MSDPIGLSQVLTGTLGEGTISTASSGLVFGVCIKSALTGSLTVTGISQASGAPQSWVIPATTSGYVAAPGSGKFWGSLMYALSNAGADTGKAFIAFAQF